MKETVIYKNKNQLKLKADFYRAGRNNQTPVVVYIHGGGFIWGSREDINEELLKLFLDNGFAVFSIDYRLAPESMLASILEDVEDALAWLRTEGVEKYAIDPERIVVVGGSAGGFLALNTGLFQHKPRAIVSFYGYGDISAKWANEPSAFYRKKELIPRELALGLRSKEIISEGPIEGRYLYYLYARQQGVWVQEVTGLNPVHNNEEILKLSPIHQVGPEFPPTLFLHGTKDTDVPYEQSVYMRAALVKKGVSAKLITIPNGEHVFEKNFNDPVVRVALGEVITFLKNQLCG
ncbi:alpha/beta hydrolase [Bacillus sp. B-jedd]|uniref:alpha/beta hydrolase n=1 Tax=Bacillus sp. B-jedd TaxID=1476857 RepID=UPI0005156B08|nr:alpha/beta hydrolase [Bacillus sp. B-jedd]CEG26924.1 Lipase [Bacillus sp. B-jedd]